MRPHGAPWRHRCAFSGGSRGWIARQRRRSASRGRIGSIARAIPARILLANGDLARAERMADEALSVSAAEPFALIARAHVWAATRPPEEAARAAEGACQA